MKPNKWISSAQADELLKKQLVTWSLPKKNYDDLQQVQTRQLDLGGITVQVQHNPARIASTGAKTDGQSIRQRQCFLCADNLPAEQIRLPFGYNYDVLCNPYPIFREHFTIVSRKHENQEIAKRLPDFLELAYRMNRHTVFYNGPRSGASAPDHAHFQAVTRGQMPIEKELHDLPNRYAKEILSLEYGKLFALTHYFRNGFVIEASDKKTISLLFHLIYKVLDKKPDEPEPGMNLFASYDENQWRLILIPRHKHRPWQYDATGEDHILSSPGAADIGGLFITPREEDFMKINPHIIQNIYEQVGYADDEILKLTDQIVAKHKSNNKL
ncbi:DUF4922 domain-containing protein [Parabacteroides sp. PF5-6]|uniref:DUF4922 domain-containing protein n=1 Tax=Parabacteroides sp. PF5-6 TaxID=1742403 RepID=UPI0024076B2C|nr:DUF4922 domain-containing protein [Parabacteroides sp. PF5-6]MDF9830699.1 ATP adenylyltransferase/5',5'''-P-1,P-4-tetraphosphate phosphorylase II [Parabacteroides sp. PF5-6]